MPTSSWIDLIGHWNPQFLRECRGRLRPRNLITTISLALFAQMLLLLFSRQLPLQRYFWLYNFRAIFYVLPYILFAAGAYSLVTDLTLEEARGTLNFIRLTPRPSVTILWGKILGVPILWYVGLGLCIPLHLISAIVSKVPLGFLVSYYMLLAASGLCLFSAALLVALLSRNQLLLVGQQSPIALGVSAIILLLFSPLFIEWNLYTTWRPFRELLMDHPGNSDNLIQWFYLPVGQNTAVAHLFTFTGLVLATLGIWRILRRRFYSPSVPVLSKRQSYGVVAYTQILLFGFFLNSSLGQDSNKLAFSLIIMYFFTLFLFLSIVNTLTPNHAHILDWLRYEQRDRGSLLSWIWADKSPIPVAIAINLLIANAPLAIWIAFWPFDDRVHGLLLLASLSCFILIHSLIFQIILLTKLRRPQAWGLGAIVALFFLPPIVLALLQLTPERVLFLWLFLGWPLTNLRGDGLLLTQIIVLVSHLLVLGGLLVLLLHRLHNLKQQQA